MKTIHVKVAEELFEEFKELLNFHGGISVGIRIALKNFIRDVKSGKITLGEDTSHLDTPTTIKVNNDQSLNDILGGRDDRYPGEGGTPSSNIPEDEESKS